jgi:hypothetical protein
MLKTLPILLIVFVAGCSQGRLMQAKDFKELSPAVQWVRAPGERPVWLWLFFIPAAVSNDFDQVSLGDGYLTVVEGYRDSEGATAYSYAKVTRTISLRDGSLLPPKPAGKTSGQRLAFRDFAYGSRHEAVLPNGLTLIVWDGFRKLDGLHSDIANLVISDAGSTAGIASSQKASDVYPAATYFDLGGGRILLVFSRYIFCIDCNNVRLRPTTRPSP